MCQGSHYPREPRFRGNYGRLGAFFWFLPEALERSAMQAWKSSSTPDIGIHDETPELHQNPRQNARKILESFLARSAHCLTSAAPAGHLRGVFTSRAIARGGRDFASRSALSPVLAPNGAGSARRSGSAVSGFAAVRGRGIRRRPGMGSVSAPREDKLASCTRAQGQPVAGPARATHGVRLRRHSACRFAHFPSLGRVGRARRRALACHGGEFVPRAVFCSRTSCGIVRAGSPKRRERPRSVTNDDATARS